MAARTVRHLPFLSTIPSSIQCLSAGTVLLHLVAASIGRRTSPSTRKPLSAVYIPVPSPFPELEVFIEDAARAYNLDLYHCPHSNGPVEAAQAPGPSAASAGERPKSGRPGEGMRVSLELYKARFPGVEAIVIGTRRSDPHGGECIVRASSHTIRG